MQNISSTFWDYDWLNDYVFCFLVAILFLVGTVLAFLVGRKGVFIQFYENSSLEFVWTIFPAVILLFIGVPRISMLYCHRVDFSREISVKVTGHQWYWSYDFLDFPEVEFDSFMAPTDTLGWGDFRLLEVDNKIVVPGKQYLRFIVSSGDVLHSWALPAMSVKVDACPGRLNFIFFKPTIFGRFFGQCREICGANHSFIPISLEVTSPTLFSRWLTSFR